MAKVSDAYSGIAAGEIAVDGSAVATTLAAGRLTATLPSRRSPAAQA